MTEALPWLIGPAGIVLGWWLNQLTMRGNAEREAAQAAEAAERQRVLDTVRLGRTTASLVRSLLHAMYLKSQYGRPPKGVAEMMDEFNRVRDEFRSAVLSVRVLGPSWAVEDGERLDVEIARLAELAFLMQDGVKQEHMVSTNADLPALDRMLNAYIATVSERYNSTSSDLPAPPDMDIEARWTGAKNA